MLRACALVLALFVAAVPARSVTPAQSEWGIGAAVQGGPALSVQYAPSRQDAYHVLAHIGNDEALFQADYQQFYRPRSLSIGHVRGGVYGGLGLLGRAARDGADGEQWFLHLPVGLQADVLPLHLSIFVEAAAAIGALPGTGLLPVVSGGVRAVF